MMNSILADLVRVNLAGAAAILVVLAARGPARGEFLTNIRSWHGAKAL